VYEEVRCREFHHIQGLLKLGKERLDGIVWHNNLYVENYVMEKPNNTNASDVYLQLNA
jgi:hypothetical protein